MCTAATWARRRVLIRLKPLDWHQKICLHLACHKLTSFLPARDDSLLAQRIFKLYKMPTNWAVVWPATWPETAAFPSASAFPLLPCRETEALYGVMRARVCVLPWPSCPQLPKGWPVCGKILTAFQIPNWIVTAGFGSGCGGLMLDEAAACHCSSFGSLSSHKSCLPHAGRLVMAS